MLIGSLLSSQGFGELEQISYWWLGSPSSIENITTNTSCNYIPASSSIKMMNNMSVYMVWFLHDKNKQLSIGDINLLSQTGAPLSEDFKPANIPSTF